jgi:4'-phosphopantetheinyl transferase
MNNRQLWINAPPRLRLPGDEIHIWQVSLDQSSELLDRLLETLSGDERARAGRFHFERDRRRFICARAALRSILGLYLEIKPEKIEFCYSKYGKPDIFGAKGENLLYFNLSHSHELALLAVSRRWRVGIDIEHVRSIPDAEQIAERFFSAAENVEFRALPSSKREESFLNCWTRKEAFIKAIGEGLSRPLDRFDVSLSPGEPARLLKIDGDTQEASIWSLAEIAPAPGYIAALAVEGHGYQLSFWQWN